MTIKQLTEAIVFNAALAECHHMDIGKQWVLGPNDAEDKIRSIVRTVIRRTFTAEALDGIELDSDAIARDVLTYFAQP